MGKRTAFEDDAKAAHHERHTKRQRIDRSRERESQYGAATVPDVTSAHQLRDALVFEQGSASGLRSGLNLLKKFLDSILYSTEDHDLPRKRAILREYLDTQKDQGKEAKDAVLLPQFIQAWDFAAETNFEALLTQITAVLALLFKAFSTHADFLPYGSLLCKTILQPSVARRLVRSLSAQTSKEQVIMPALRLLTEMTKFNEGAFARAVYARRDFTLEPKILARNIGTWKDSAGQTALELQRKPSLRTTAVRYLLTHLRFQDEQAKIEIISHKDVVRAVLDHLTTDPTFLISEIFDVFKNHIFLDKTIPRHVKSKILNGRALTHIASLYRYEPPEGSLVEGEKAPDVLAHEFLCLVCTSPAYGVMLPTNGLYPNVKDEDEGEAPVEEIADLGDLELDHSVGHDSGAGSIRNVVLGDFLQALRPYANNLHQELAIQIFKACPELVADYFHRKQDFNYDPKLTSTWIGFSALLYETIELPVPPFFGARKRFRSYPPTVSSMLHGILPQPLTQHVLVKCLNSSSDLVSLFAVRVLITAFQKLQLTLKELSAGSASTTSRLWMFASKRLVSEFSQRCPSMKSVIVAFRQPAFQKGLKRESITRLLRLYYEVTPQVALEEKFDVSVPLCNTLVEVENSSGSAEERAFRVIELEHWIQMARHSPSMRWWQRNKSLHHSPFLTLLKLAAVSAEPELYAGIKALLAAILRDHDMLQMKTSPDALEALIASLGTSCGSSAPSSQVLDFLDDSCGRFIKAPIKYLDDLDSLCARRSLSSADIGPFSPLVMTFVEQWPFKGGKSEKGNPADAIAQWLSKLLYLLKLIGEEESVLELVRDSLVETSDIAYKDLLRDSFLWKMGKEKAKEVMKLATGAAFSDSERSTASPKPVEHPAETGGPVQDIDLELPPDEDEKHAGLTRWRKKDIEESIDDGDVGALLLCLCSKHTEIRLQAVNSIRQLMATLDKDKSDLQQLYVLLGEVLESVEDSPHDQRFPYIGGVFAARCVSVLADPTHFMFGKINKFLTSRPSWEVRNLPRRFARSIVNSEPDDDGAYHKEVDWFFDYLLDSLRTPEDMEIFRTNNIFERLLSYYSSKSCAISAKEKIVRLLMRAVAVGGGTTLITRCGLMSWIQMMLRNNDHRHQVLRRLASRVYETCNQEKVTEWSSGTMADFVATIVDAER